MDSLRTIRVISALTCALGCGQIAISAEPEASCGGAALRSRVVPFGAPSKCLQPCRFGCCKRAGSWLFRRRTFSTPDMLPLGSSVRAHFGTMEENAEASDFVLYHHEFVDGTAALTPAGRDHIVQIAARSGAVPFPVLVERSEHNSTPELDAFRRGLVVRILSDFGVTDADQRTFVAPAYGRHANSLEAEADYLQFLGGSAAGAGAFGGGYGGRAAAGFGGSFGY